MPPLPQLDHTVINVRYEMDDAETRFRDLGFHLTERGFHSLGSINHLMMFDRDYLELIGLPKEARAARSGRPDIENAPFGINGLVFKTASADDTFAHLEAIGMAGDPPKSFSRPVELPEGRFDARFRTVHVRGDAFPGGRVYFCEHGTPELVWRPEWQVHENGARKTTEFVIASENFEHEADAMARVLNTTVDGDGAQRSVRIDGSVITFMSPARYRERYGDLASNQAGDEPSIEGVRSSLFGAIVIGVTNLDVVKEMAAAKRWLSMADEQRVVIRQPAFDCVIEFVALD